MRFSIENNLLIEENKRTKNFQGIFITFIFLLVFCQLIFIPSALANLKKYEKYPFLIKIPNSWKSFSEKKILSMRKNFEKRMPSIYKKYYGIDMGSFINFPYFEAFHSLDNKSIFSVLVVRFPPKKNYLNEINKDLENKMEWAKKQGLLKNWELSKWTEIGIFKSVSLDIELSNGSWNFITYLYDKEMPYQFIMLSLNSLKDRKQSKNVFKKILYSLKVDFSFKGNVGKEGFVFSKKCQKYFMVTRNNEIDLKRVIMIFQEPHWDYLAQWNLVKGLEIFFEENQNLLKRSVFLSEGTKAMKKISVSELSHLDNNPSSDIVKKILESYLITGYQAFNWMMRRDIPTYGIEDWSLYNESAKLWAEGKYNRWAVTVAARNKRIVEVLLKMKAQYDNPMLFVGLMHLYKIPQDLFFKGQEKLNPKSSAKKAINAGIEGLLNKHNLNFIFIEPVMDITIQQNSNEIERYRKLFFAQLDHDYESYIENFLSNRANKKEKTKINDGVTNTSNPQQAAKLLSKLKKNNNGEPSKGKGKKNKDAQKGKKAKIDNLLKAGKQPDKNGLTKAGRGLQKHGDRKNSIFPKSKGSPAERNKQGQDVLEGILKSNNKTSTPNRFGDEDIYDNNTGRGVRFNKDGSMRGFLEP